MNNYEYLINLIKDHEDFNEKFFDSKLNEIKEEIRKRISYRNPKNFEQRILDDENLYPNDLKESKKKLILKLIEYASVDIHGLYEELLPYLDRMDNLIVNTFAYYKTSYYNFILAYSEGYNLIEIMTPMLMCDYMRRWQCQFRPEILYKNSITENVKIFEKVEPYRDQITSSIKNFFEKIKSAKRIPHLFESIMAKLYYYRLFYYPYVTGKMFSGSDEDFLDFIVNENGLLKRICSEFDYCNGCKDKEWYYEKDIPRKYLENENCQEYDQINTLKILHNGLIYEKRFLSDGENNSSDFDYYVATLKYIEQNLRF